MVRPVSRPTSVPRSFGFRALIALLIALSVSACAGSSSRSDASTTITIGTAIPPTRDPTTGVSAVVNLLTLEGPINIGWDGKAVPRAIDHWEWSADGLTLRLRLLPGLRFHDGTVLTNAIAAEILRHALGPESGAVSTTVKSVTAEGRDEIVVRTGQPEGFLLSDIWMADLALPGHPHVGTGPFRLDSTTGGIVLKAFDGYRSGRPKIDAVHIAEYETQRQAWAAMMRGEADVLYDVSVESLDFVEAESTVQTRPFLKSYYQALGFNLTLPLFKQKDVRRALNTAVDRTQVVELGLRKRGVPSDGPIWPHHYGHSSEQATYSHDPARAEALLDTLGLTRGREHQPGRMPSRFRFTCLVAREDQRLQRIALVVQKQLFNIGVDMDVEVRPVREVQKRVFGGQFEAFLWEFSSLRSLSFVYRLWHSPPPGAKNPFDLHYSAADPALDRLRGAFREEDVPAAVAELQRAFYEDPPAVFLDWIQNTRALSRSIELPNEGARDVMGSIQQWRPVRAKDER